MNVEALRPGWCMPVAKNRSKRWSACSLCAALLTGLLAFALAGAASAQDSPARKLGRGAANLSLGVLAIPSEVVETTKERGPAVGVTWGLAKGIGLMVATEVIGLWEVLTCPFATPPDYRPILSPEFPWQRFTGDPRAKTDVRTAGSAPGGGRRVPR